MLNNDLVVFDKYIRFLEAMTETLIQDLKYINFKTEGYYAEWKDEIYKEVTDKFVEIEKVLKRLVKEIDSKNDVLKQMKRQIENYLGGIR